MFIIAARHFLEQHDPLKLNVVDLISWLNSALIVQMNAGVDLLANLPSDFAEQLANKIESFRRDDGGYAKSEQGAAGIFRIANTSLFTHFKYICFDMNIGPFPINCP